MVKIMNKLFNLQRFAEDTSAQADNPNTADTAPEGKAGDGAPSFTAEQQAYINQLVNSRLERERTKAQKDAQDKAEAARLQAMGEQDRLNEKLKQALDRIDQYEATQTKNTMMAEARKILKSKGYDFSDDVIAPLIGKDAEATKAKIDAFTADFDKALNAKLTATVSSTTPKAGVKSGKSLTKKDIMAVKNTRERQKLIKEHMELFQKG